MSDSPYQVPLVTRRSGSVYLHIYKIKHTLYFRTCYNKDGTLPVSDILKYCIEARDAVGALGASMFVALRQYNYSVKLEKEEFYLDPEGLQLAINSAFETPEAAFTRLGESYRDHFLSKAERRAATMGQSRRKKGDEE